MVGPKKDTAYFSDSLEVSGGAKTPLPCFRVTMPSGRPPTLEELQQITGLSAEQAAKLLQEILR
jgi:hypothetical protein